MVSSIHDNMYLSELFSAGEVSRLFAPSAEVRAMLVVEGALAKAQGSAGVIPEISAAAIQRAAVEVQIDPAALANATAQNGVVVPALVTAFREAMQAPEHSQYVHWGATSQDIIDTALMLRLRQSVALIRTSVVEALTAYAGLAEHHAETAMIARTYGQQGAPTSFGAIVAAWGWPLLSALKTLDHLNFYVSLSGAVGTGSALGPDPGKLRADMADSLALKDPNRSWHTDRTPLLAILTAATSITRAFAKMGEDAIAMTQSEVSELNLGAAGASSTMPQKQNPVGPSALVALATAADGYDAIAKTAATHRFQRDGAAWFAEWMVVPQIILATAAAARKGTELAKMMQPKIDNMAQKLNEDGLLMSETLSFALTSKMSRPDAQAAAKEIATQVRDTGKPLGELAFAKWPDLPPDTFSPQKGLGTASTEAREFANAVRKL